MQPHGTGLHTEVGITYCWLKVKQHLALVWAPTVSLKIAEEKSGLYHQIFTRGINQFNRAVSYSYSKQSVSFYPQCRRPRFMGPTYFHINTRHTPVVLRQLMMQTSVKQRSSLNSSLCLGTLCRVERPNVSIPDSQSDSSRCFQVKTHSMLLKAVKYSVNVTLLTSACLQLIF